MARPLRIAVAGGFYHLVQRGNYRQTVFLADRDREAFLERLGKCAGLFDVRVHAYCLMSNHTKHRREGHLFQGRFKSFLVDEGSYLGALARYIHLNPVRAGMVKKPEE
mgnify:CR=1 FL=1